jgi:hypothetical protein
MHVFKEGICSTSSDLCPGRTPTKNGLVTGGDAAQKTERIRTKIHKAKSKNVDRPDAAETIHRQRLSSSTQSRFREKHFPASRYLNEETAESLHGRISYPCRLPHLAHFPLYGIQRRDTLEPLTLSQERGVLRFASCSARRLASESQGLKQCVWGSRARYRSSTPWA